MGSYREKDGVPPGTYKVGISGATLDLDESGFSIYDLIDPKCASPTLSGIEVTIDKKTVKGLEIKVERNPKPRPAGKEK
jgi:hypothetical protein